MSEINLSTGERSSDRPVYRRPSDPEPPKRGRPPGSKSTASKSKQETPPVSDAEAKSRIDRVFDHLAEWREAKGDSELADVIRDDSEVMGNSLISITKSLPFLRGPVIFIVSFLEPLLSFGRVGRILVGRFFNRRNTQPEESQQ